MELVNLSRTEDTEGTEELLARTVGLSTLMGIDSETVI
jgi:hypothetical protein